MQDFLTTHELDRVRKPPLRRLPEGLPVQREQKKGGPELGQDILTEALARVLAEEERHRDCYRL